jgi:predicted nucleic acid-binding protein
MRVVDTSLWVEYLADGQLADHAEQCILPLDTCIIPAMVSYELSKWSQRKFDAKQAESLLSLLTECTSVDMDTAVALEAAALSIQHKLHATDAIIYATACVSKATLFTCDAHFKGLPGVTFIEKAA